MPNLKPMEILLIILVVLLLFGAKRLPDLARGVGKSLRILKDEVKDLNDDDRPQSTGGATTPAATTAPLSTTPTNTHRDPVTHSQAADDIEHKQV